GNLVGPTLIADGDELAAGREVAGGNGGAGKDGFRFVADGAVDGGGVDLRGCRHRQAESGCEHEDEESCAHDASSVSIGARVATDTTARQERRDADFREYFATRCHAPGASGAGCAITLSRQWDGRSVLHPSRPRAATGAWAPAGG